MDTQKKAGQIGANFNYSNKWHSMLF